MASEYFVLSNFGLRYFIKDYDSSLSADANVPASVSGADEITSIISAEIGSFSKENTKYRTLNSNGWESIAVLGNTADDATFECIREGQGNPFINDSSQTDTYSKIKYWFMQATKGAGLSSPKVIVEILPRGTNSFEGTCYFVVPNNWGPGTKDTETGQEFSFTVSPFGPQKPVSVSYNRQTDTFTLTDVSGDFYMSTSATTGGSQSEIKIAPGGSGILYAHNMTDGGTLNVTIEGPEGPIEGITRTISGSSVTISVARSVTKNTYTAICSDGPNTYPINIVVDGE